MTPIGGWGPWIVGGGWLSVAGRKVDLLYRNIEAVADDDREVPRGRGRRFTISRAIRTDFAPRSGWARSHCAFRSTIPTGRLATLKAATSPYPRTLRDALIRKFDWEILFAIENAELAAGRAEQTHVAGCVYRALACTAQVLFALNERYLINEKGALQEAATLPRTIPDIAKRANDIWRLIGSGELRAALAGLRAIERDVKQLASCESQLDGVEFVMPLSPRAGRGRRAGDLHTVLSENPCDRTRHSRSVQRRRSSERPMPGGR